MMISHVLRRVIPAALLVMGPASGAFAQGDTSNTLGQSIFGAMGDMVGPILVAISFFAFLVGIFLVGKGIMKFKDASSHHGGGVGPAAFTLMAGVLLIALPEASGIGMTSVMGTGGLFGSGDLQAARVMDAADDGTGKASTITRRVLGFTTPKGVENCLVFTGTDNRADAVGCMAKNIANNVVPVGIIAVFAFVFLAGLWQLGSAFGELAKQEQNRGSLPNGWWMKVFTAILMMNGPFLLQAASKSVTGQVGPIGGTGLQEGSSLLRYTNVGGVFTQYESLIGYCFTILALFGVMAFVRGLFIMKSAGEGRSNSTMGHGIVFMVAGVLLANSKVSTCVIMNTMMGSGFGFCS
ncbi:putative membrane protein (plasmid) [Bosea sp. RAC05]|nr:putative membrane protein [Bosea sp. RAC05]